MRRIFASIVVAAMMTLSAACASIGGGSVAVTSPDTVATAEKSLIVAHLALNFIGDQLVVQARPGGLLSGQNARTAQCIYDKADDALKAADAADAALNASGIVAQVGAAQNAMAQLNTLLKGSTSGVGVCT